MAVSLSLIGAGKMGTFHLKKFAALPPGAVQLLGFFDADANRREQTQSEFGIKAYSDIAELFFVSDAVVIASPTPTHFDFTLKALQAGCHVLVEKPVTLLVDEAEELVATATLNKLLLQVGHLERFRFRELARNIPLHGIHRIRIERLSTASGREQSLDVVSDLMVHDLDLVQHLVEGIPSQIDIHEAKEVKGVWEEVSARLEYPTGTVVEITASRIASENRRQIQIGREQGDLLFDLQNNRVFGNGEPRELSLDALALQAASFIDCIENRKAPLVSGAEAVRSLQLVRRIIDGLTDRPVPSGETIQPDAPTLPQRF